MVSQMHVPAKVDCWVPTDIWGLAVCRAFSTSQQVMRVNGFACVGCARLPRKFRCDLLLAVRDKGE